MAKTLQIPMRKATQTGKHRKKRCETDRRAGFWTSAGRRVRVFFAKNTANTDKNRNLKINFGRGKCQNSSFSTCQPGNRRTPRGGRRTCCQELHASGLYKTLNPKTLIKGLGIRIWAPRSTKKALFLACWQHHTRRCPRPTKGSGTLRILLSRSRLT